MLLPIPLIPGKRSSNFIVFNPSNLSAVRKAAYSPNNSDTLVFGNT